MTATALTGRDMKMGLKVASTWGTAVACGAGDKLAAEVSPSANAQELTPREIGSGNAMATGHTFGNILPTVSLTGDVGFLNGFEKIMAQFLGSDSPAADAGAGDYVHTLTYNPTLNAKFLTLAYELDTAKVLEFPSCAVRSVTVQTTQIPGYLQYTAELVASDMTTASVTNTNATLANVTFPEGNAVLCTAKNSDKFYFSTQDDATFNQVDQLDVTSWSLQLTRPQEQVSEIRNASGVGAPSSSGLFEGTLTLGLRNYKSDVYDWFTQWAAETVFKSQLTCKGPQIGSGLYKTWDFYLPGMKLVQEPQNPKTQVGDNPLTLTFRLLKAAANPTGFTSTYPYAKVTNTLATSILA